MEISITVNDEQVMIDCEANEFQESEPDVGIGFGVIGFTAHHWSEGRELTGTEYAAISANDVDRILEELTEYEQDRDYS